MRCNDFKACDETVESAERPVAGKTITFSQISKSIPMASHAFRTSCAIAATTSLLPVRT